MNERVGLRRRRGDVWRHLDAFPERLRLGEIIQSCVALELERHTLGKSKSCRIPNFQHASGIGRDDRVVRGGGEHANSVTNMLCRKHDEARILHGSDGMGMSIASPKQRLGVGGVASSVVDAHGAA